MINRIANASTAVIALCCVLVTGVAIRREFQPSQRATRTVVPEEVRDWKSYSSAGHRDGGLNAPVTITEFSDFQCPFCRALHETMREIRREYPTEVATVFRHYPLARLHPHATTAALASECAARADRFAEFADALYAQQDSIGTTAWSDYARKAGIDDTVAFNVCLRDSLSLHRLKADQEAAKKLEVRGTPTVLVNRWRVRGGSKEVLLKLIREELAGQSEGKSGDRPDDA